MSLTDLQRESSCSCNRLHEYVTVDVSEVVSHDIHFRYCCHSFPFHKGWYSVSCTEGDKTGSSI